MGESTPNDGSDEEVLLDIEVDEPCEEEKPAEPTPIDPRKMSWEELVATAKPRNKAPAPVAASRNGQPAGLPGRDIIQGALRRAQETARSSPPSLEEKKEKGLGAQKKGPRMTLMVRRALGDDDEQ